MAPIPIGIFSQGGSGKYWAMAETLSGYTKNSSYGDIAPAANDAVYIGSLWNSNTIGQPNYAILSKYNSGGSLLWRKGISDADVTVRTFRDSSDNAYEILQDTVDNGLKIRKWDSDGNVLWYRSISGTNGGYKSFVSPSGVTYLAGQVNSDANAIDLIVINTSGSISFQKRYKGSATASFAAIVGGIHVDTATGSIYITTAGDIIGNSAKNPVNIFKINSSGVFQWVIRTVYSYDSIVYTSQYGGTNMATNADGSRLYVAIALNGQPMHIAAYDTTSSSSPWLWGKTTTTSSTHITSVQVDSSGSIFASSGTTALNISSTGSLNWSRDTYRKIRLSLANNDTAFAYHGGTVMSFAKLPAYSGLDGTYSAAGSSYVLGNVPLTFTNIGGSGSDIFTTGVTTSTPTLSLTTLATPTVYTPAVIATKADIL